MSVNWRSEIEDYLEKLNETVWYYTGVKNFDSVLVKLDNKVLFTKATIDKREVVFLQCFCSNNCSSKEYGYLDPAYKGPDATLALCPCSYDPFASLRDVFKCCHFSTKTQLEGRILFQSLLPEFGGSDGHLHYIEILKERLEKENSYCSIITPQETNYWDNYTPLPW